MSAVATDQDPAISPREAADQFHAEWLAADQPGRVALLRSAWQGLAASPSLVNRQRAVCALALATGAYEALTMVDPLGFRLPR